MAYRRKQLSKLWGIIKDSNCLWGHATGLENTEFTISLQRFEQDYRLYCIVFDQAKISIVKSVEKVLEALEGKQIKFHHLSCAAKQLTGKDSALCIHYLDANQEYCIALPGIKYTTLKA